MSSAPALNDPERNALVPNDLESGAPVRNDPESGGPVRNDPENDGPVLNDQEHRARVPNDPPRVLALASLSTLGVDRASMCASAAQTESALAAVTW